MTEGGSEGISARGRVLLFGASGTIGGAVARALAEQGYSLHCFLRPAAEADLLAGAVTHYGDVTDADSIAAEGFSGQGPFDVVISCLASRSGAPGDAWQIDYAANRDILAAARAHGAGHMILLSAICVQRPQLAFQHAKLAFEAELAASGMRWTIVRPTAFFKSLSGQVGRVLRGKPFLLFGDGTLTRCKPISDDDLARFIVQCIDDPTRHDCILPIGGPEPAITPREQGALLFELAGRPPRYRRIPIWLVDAVVAVLSAAERLSARAAGAAEYARIARYYATQSMLALDPSSGDYSEDMTPQAGRETLAGHYRGLIAAWRGREKDKSEAKRT